MRVIAFLVALAGLAACLEPSMTVCGTLACPSDTACVALATNGPTCLPIATCDRAATGDACDPGNGQEGTCEGGGCRPIERCGNGIVDSGESCDCGDAQVAPRAECNARNNSDTDPLSPCRGDCQLRTCGDEQLDATEQCEGDAIADGLSCETFGYYAGELACSSLCIVDRSACSGRCGDGTLDLDHEYCDPMTDTIAGYCTDFGYSSGQLRCGASCGPAFVDCRDGLVFTDVMPGQKVDEIVRGPTSTSAWVMGVKNLWLYDESTGLHPLLVPNATDRFLDISSVGSHVAVSTAGAQVHIYDATGTLTTTTTVPVGVCQQIVMIADDTFACIAPGLVTWWSNGTWEAGLVSPGRPVLDAIASLDGSVLFTAYEGGSQNLYNGDAYRATRTEVAGMNGWSSSLQSFHLLVDGSGPTSPGLYGGLAYGGAGYGMVKLDATNTWNLAMGTEDYLKVENVGGRQFTFLRYTRTEGAIVPNRLALSIDGADTACRRILGTGITALCLVSAIDGSRSSQLLRFAGATVSQTVPLGLGALDLLSDALIDDDDVMYYVGRTGSSGNTSPPTGWHPPANAYTWDRLAGARGTDVLALGRSGGSYTAVSLWTGSTWVTDAMTSFVTAAIPIGNHEILVSVYTLNSACDVKRGPPDALVLVEHLPFCPTSLWASPTGHLWAASTGIVRDLTNQTSWTLVSPAPATGMISGRDDTHLWFVAGREIWFFDGTSWTKQLGLSVPTDFEWVSADENGVVATSRRPTPMTWLLVEGETTWNKLRLPSDSSAMIEPQLRPWGIVFRTTDGTLRYSVWENGWPQ